MASRINKKPIAGAAAPSLAPAGLKLPAHKFKSTAPKTVPKPPSIKLKAPPKFGAATKGAFLQQTPMDKSALRPPKIAKAKKAPAVKKPTGLPKAALPSY